MRRIVVKMHGNLKMLCISEGDGDDDEDDDKEIR